MANNLTPNAFRTMFSTSLPPDQVMPNPVLQVLQVKQIPAQPNTPDRYRVVLSDGSNFVQAMLATQANPLVVSGDLVKGCIVTLRSYQANKVKGRRILVVIDIQVMKHLGIKEKIGGPVALDESFTESEPAAPIGGVQPQAAGAGAFYGQKPQAAAPTRPPGGGSLSSKGAAASGGAHTNVYPIESLSPYQNKWTIKARVTHKSDIKYWENQKSSGKLFNVSLLDETGEIRMTAFGEQVDAFFDVLQEGSVYHVSKCRVGMAKKQFSNVDNDYELTLTRDSEVVQCTDDDVPQMRYNFIRIMDLPSVENNQTIDVIGVVREVAAVETITAKQTQKAYSKREITLVDDSNAQVRCTVWGNTATGWDVPEGTVIAFKGLKVSEFGGRSLSMGFSSTMTSSPDIDEAHQLKGWYDGQGDRPLNTFTSHIGLANMGESGGRSYETKTTAQVRELESTLGTEDVVYFALKAMIVYIKHENYAYASCTILREDGKPCNKKVNKFDDESWHCERCNQYIPTPEWRYILSLSVNDPYSQLWLSCFDDVGRRVLGQTANELKRLEEESPDEMNQAFNDALCQTFTFRIRGKKDTYQEQERMRYNVINASPLDYKAECAKLVEKIKLYSI